MEKLIEPCYVNTQDCIDLVVHLCCNTVSLKGKSCSILADLLSPAYLWVTPDLYMGWKTALIVRGTDSIRCWKHSSEFTQLLYIHNANLSFQHILKILYWIEIGWLWRLFEYNELLLFKKPVWADLGLSYLFWEQHLVWSPDPVVCSKMFFCTPWWQRGFIWIIIASISAWNSLVIFLWHQ